MLVAEPIKIQIVKESPLEKKTRIYRERQELFHQNANETWAFAKFFFKWGVPSLFIFLGVYGNRAYWLYAAVWLALAVYLTWFKKKQ